MTARTVLLLGSTGFIGRHLVQHLSQSPAIRMLAPTRAELDVTDMAAAEALLRASRPEAVVNCAAATGIGAVEGKGDLTDTLNRIVPAHWAEACTRVGARLVHFSTDQVFGGDKRSPYHEGDAGNPPSVYGATKYAGERAVLQHPAHLVVRTSFVFGAGGNTFMSRLPRLLASSSRVTVVTGVRGSCIHVTRLCEYVAWLIAHRARGLVHVANRGEVSWESFAEACLAEVRRTGAAGHDVCLERVSYESMRDRLGPRALYSVLDISRFEQMVGHPVPCWTSEIPGFVRAALENPPAV